MTSVAALFEAAGVTRAGVVRWGTEVPLDAPGVYVIALNADAHAQAGRRVSPIDRESVAELLRARPEASIDGVRADVDRMIDRLQRMWVPGESAVYIGLAGNSVRERIDQFYATRIGARAPHAGGWPIKMIDQSSAPLWVHFGLAADPDRAEIAMVDGFARGVPPELAAELIDPGALLPFANLTFPRGRRKRHGFQGVKAPRVPLSGSRVRAPGAAAPSTPSVGALDVSSQARARVSRRRTQNITANDIRVGQLRIPRESKDVFPAMSARVVVRVNGETREVRWDPQTTGGRSGILGLGVAMMREHFKPGGQREVIEIDGVYEIH